MLCKVKPNICNMQIYMQIFICTSAVVRPIFAEIGVGAGYAWTVDKG